MFVQYPVSLSLVRAPVVCVPFDNTSGLEPSVSLDPRSVLALNFSETGSPDFQPPNFGSPRPKLGSPDAHDTVKTFI